jgi:hypothetical protein
LLDTLLVMAFRFFSTLGSRVSIRKRVRRRVCSEDHSLLINYMHRVAGRDCSQNGKFPCNCPRSRIVKFFRDGNSSRRSGERRGPRELDQPHPLAFDRQGTYLSPIDSTIACRFLTKTAARACPPRQLGRSGGIFIDKNDML